MIQHDAMPWRQNLEHFSVCECFWCQWDARRLVPLGISTVHSYFLSVSLCMMITPITLCYYSWLRFCNSGWNLQRFFRSNINLRFGRTISSSTYTFRLDLNQVCSGGDFLYPGPISQPTESRKDENGRWCVRREHSSKFLVDMCLQSGRRMSGDWNYLRVLRTQPSSTICYDCQP